MALNEEQKLLLADVRSLLQQIDSIEAGGKNNKEVNMDENTFEEQETLEEDVTMSETEEDVMMSEAEEDEIVAKAKSIIKKRQAKKSSVGKSDLGINADDDAESRERNGEPEQNKKNVSEVAKSLNQLNKSMLQMAKVLKSVSDNNESNTQAIENILSGIGVTQNVMKSEGFPRRTPVADRDRVIKSLKNVAKSKDSQVDVDSMGIGDVLTSIFS